MTPTIKFCKPSEVSKYLGITFSRAKIYRMIDAGEIVTTKGLSGVRLIDIDATLERWKTGINPNKRSTRRRK